MGCDGAGVYNAKKVEPLGWTFFERKTRLKLATLSLEG